MTTGRETTDAAVWIRRLFWGLVSCEVIFLVLDYQLNYGARHDIAPIKKMFNGTREDSIYSWFSIVQTWMVAMTALYIYLRTRRLRGPSWPTTTGWLILAGFFGYMSMDDGSKIHERVGSTFRGLAVHAEEQGGSGGIMTAFPSYGWQVVFLPIFGAFGLFAFWFLWRELPKRRSRAMLLLALSCFVIAVGMDFVEGLDPDHPWNLYTIIADRVDMAVFTARRFGKRPFTALRHFSKTIEESTEMLGNTFFWIMFLEHACIGLRRRKEA